MSKTTEAMRATIIKQITKAIANIPTEVLASYLPILELHVLDADPAPQSPEQ